MRVSVGPIQQNDLNVFIDTCLRLNVCDCVCVGGVFLCKKLRFQHFCTETEIKTEKKFLCYIDTSLLSYVVITDKYTIVKDRRENRRVHGEK